MSKKRLYRMDAHTQYNGVSDTRMAPKSEEIMRNAKVMDRKVVNYCPQ